MATRAVHVETTGDGPPIVLIHGLGATSDVWHAQRVAFGQTFRVITYDRGGCGRSAKPPGGFSVDSWVDELAGLLDRLAVEETVVVGHSLGSMIAQRFAARFPSRTRALVLAGGEAVLPVQGRDVLTERVALIREQGLPAVVDGWLMGVLSSNTRSTYPALTGLLRGMFLANDDESYADQAEALRDADVSADDTAIDCPTLLLVGDEDPVTPLGWQEQIAASIAGSRIGVIPRTAHMTMLEVPEAFNSAVLEFLDEVAPGTASAPVPADLPLTGGPRD